MACLDLILVDILLGGLNHLLFAQLAACCPSVFAAAVIGTLDQLDRPASLAIATCGDDGAQGEGEWRAWT